jgi:amino acid adenylation domain-containing protein
VLEAGFETGFSWTRRPAPGERELEVAVPEPLRAASRRLADALEVPWRTLLLCAHAKVLGALSGERVVSTGYAADGGPAVPCRLTLAPPTWRALLQTAAQAEHALRARRGDGHGGHRQPVDGAGFDTAFAGAAPARGPLARPIVFELGWAGPDPRALRLRYRAERIDAECAARVAGYHLAALAGLTGEPDAAHAGRGLLSETELRFQLDGLAGPRRARPDRRVHELFEERVRAQPDAIAAVCGSERRTFREVNARANQLARALCARGLGPEDVVAVVADRGVDWMAAVLAIFKAGGVYLPIDPRYPVQRVAWMLTRADCRLVLCEGASAALVNQALVAARAARRLDLEAALAEGQRADDLDVPVAADQLAYIFFTSGSTGEPKGAMCEHAGMVNHLCAKIDDLRLGPDAVVAQSASQCFDISLWQLLAAPLAGGRTLLVEREAILEVPRFVERLASGAVTVAQVVPSYLEVVVSYLEQRPRALPGLRFLSVTGEALPPALVRRWFAVAPATPLVNAYGLTETCDDTNHEVLSRPPADGRVPLGRPLPNVRIYVVDAALQPVPLGAVGEVVFSGVCVGRGYVNDPDRTRAAFVADPHRAGQRLYRSGDLGRWRADGKLEHLGRRDGQVKVNGLRIELGEIEEAITRVSGAGEAAVVVVEGAGGKRLAAFYTGPLAAPTLRAHLRERLPAHLLPWALWPRSRLPLTENRKLDRRALAALAHELALAGPEHEPPRSATEERLAAAWAEVLGLPAARIGRRAHFFELGGTSLAAVRVALALDRQVSVKDLTERPILVELAALIDDRSEPKGAA